MKATGIVRRFDDLGRIVIPKELRRQIFGTPKTEDMLMEIFMDKDTIVLRKYEENKADDVCQWKVFDNSLTNVPQLVYETTCGKYVGEEHTSKAFVYCPYCSKKIYAVNVEQKLELKHL